MSNNHLAIAATKVCPMCRRIGRNVYIHPVTNFVRDKHQADGLSIICMECTNLIVSSSTVERRAKAISAFQAAMAQEFKANANSNAGDGTEAKQRPIRVDQLVDGFVHQFGGLEEFLSEWVDQLKIASRSRPGSVTALTGFGTIAKLINAAGHQRPKLKDPGDMSDEELQQAAMLLVDEALQREAYQKRVKALTLATKEISGHEDEVAFDDAVDEAVRDSNMRGANLVSEYED